MSVAGNRDFVLSILHAIATTPALAPLYASLVLKGGVALNLRYASDRLSIGDMDFGLTQKDRQITQDDFDTLLAELDDWTARPKLGDRGLIPKGDGTDTPVITYVHPGTRERGELTLQVNSSQAPPVLMAELERRDPETFVTWDGRSFPFRVLVLEEIVAEKLCRLWRPDKHPPRPVDLYDLGFCSEQPDLDRRLVVRVLKEHRKARSEGRLIRIDEAMPVVRRVVKNVPAQVELARRLALYGADTTDAMIVGRIKAGFDLLLDVKSKL